MRKPGPAVRDGLADGGGVAGAQDDEGEHGLTPRLVGHADHGRLRDRRALVEAVLDRDRRHVLAAGDDYVLTIGNIRGEG